MSEPLRHRIGAARRNTALLRLPFARSATPYVGWVGEGNLGDEAMFLAHRRLLPELRFESLPPRPSPGLLRAIARTPLTVDAVCLGGGTLVGNGHFRQALEATVAAWPAAPRFTIGVGVEDPGYAEGRRRDVRAELERWAPVLDAFATVGVRGPLSERALANIGVEATVVGDPALGLVPRPGRTEAGLLGLNVGRVDDQWGQDEGAFRRAIVAFAQRAIAGGWRVHLISTWTPDAAFQRELAMDIGPGATAVAPSADVEATIDELGRCEVLVGHKLHACVLAAVAAVPAIALEYRPKCRDFMASVGRDEHIMRTDAVDPTELLRWVDATSRDRPTQSAALATSVAELRASLLRAAATVRAAVG